MANWRTHPEEGDLIRYSDGELRARETARVASHLEACWDCRTRLDDLKETIAEYVRYRRDVTAPAYPEPPRAWMDLRAEFARVAERESGWKRTLQRRAVWLIATAAAAGTGVFFYSARQVKPGATGGVVSRPVTVAPASPPSVAPPVRPAVRKAAPGPEDELRVIAALDRIGADLGDPVEVVRLRDRIVVKCLGLEAGRAREVQTALAAIPGVAVEVSPKAPASASGSALDVVGGPRPADNEQFIDSLLKSSEAMMARAHALRGLALRFPPAVESGMSGDARKLLAGIRDGHEGVLAREVAAIGGLLQAPAPVAGSGDEVWQTRALRVFAEAEQVDRLIGAMYARPRGAQGVDRAALSAAVVRLEGDVSR